MSRRISAKEGGYCVEIALVPAFVEFRDTPIGFDFPKAFGGTNGAEERVVGEELGFC
jgi:hypothetical protein